ncbi:phage tail protein [Pararobbsia silviterrae]|uniref:Phage tail protein n=1 Tax=Pararobbsia silviterrae TaxID=1792498 RepID=A0A494X6H1_9BURK|nr:phage tail protein [Pararobbsia silviterrae]RKP43794.1 phage tail protein [Pararobbsia silviterrae]
MAARVFTWGARVGDKGDVSFAVLSAKFGDGYQQDAADGINNRSDTWPYTYIGYEHEVGPIVEFLEWHGGYKAFQWSPPFGRPGLYKCVGYSLTPQGGPKVQLTATFTRDTRTT